MIEVYLYKRKIESLNDANHMKHYRFEMYVDKGKLKFKSNDPLQFCSIYDEETIDLLLEGEYWVFPKNQRDKEGTFFENLHNTFGSYIIQTKNEREAILVTINSNQKEYNEMLYDLLEISSEIIEGNTRVTGYLNEVLDPNNSEEQNQQKDLERLLQKIENAETSSWDFKNIPVVKRERYNSSDIRDSVQAQILPKGSKVKKKKMLKTYDTNANRYVKFQLKVLADSFVPRTKYVSKHLDDGTDLLEKMHKLSNKVNKLCGLNLTIFAQKLSSQNNKREYSIVDLFPNYKETIFVDENTGAYLDNINNLNSYLKKSEEVPFEFMKKIDNLSEDFEKLLTETTDVYDYKNRKDKQLVVEMNYGRDDNLELRKRIYSLLKKLPFSEVQIPDGYVPQADQTFFHSPWYISLLQEFQKQRITFSAFPTPEIFQQREFTPERITTLYEKWILVKLIHTLIVDLNFKIDKNALTEQLITFLSRVDKNSNRIQLTFKKKEIGLTLYYEPKLMVSDDENMPFSQWDNKTPDIVLVMDYKGEKSAAIADAKLRDYGKNNGVSEDLLNVAIIKYGRRFIKIKKEVIPIVSSFIFHSSSNRYYDKRYQNFHIGYVENPDEKRVTLFRHDSKFEKYIKDSAHRYGVLNVSPSHFLDLKKWIAMNLEYHMKVEDYCWDCGAEPDVMFVTYRLTESLFLKKICRCINCHNTTVVTHCKSRICNEFNQNNGRQYRLFKRISSYHEHSKINVNNVICPNCYGQLSDLK